MRYASEKLLQALALGGAGIPVALAGADLFLGPENGTNSGEIPLNFLLGLAPSVAAGAVGLSASYGVDKSEAILEELRRSNAAKWESDFRQMAEVRARELEERAREVGLSWNNLHERTKKQLKERASKEIGEELDRSYAGRMRAINEEMPAQIARQKARGLGVMAATAAGLAIPTSMVMAQDWGAQKEVAP